MKIWKMLTAASALLIGTAALAFYFVEDKKAVITKLTGPKIGLHTRLPNPSEETQKTLQKYVDERDYVLGLIVAKVDFRENTRTTTLRYFKEQIITDSWNDYQSGHPGNGAPLFTGDEPANQRIVNLINGQFYCLKTADVAAGKLIPRLLEFSTDACFVPIPPGYGDFSGFMTIFLKRAPSANEVARIEEAMNRISKDFYERDIARTDKTYDGRFGVPLK